MGYTNNNVWLLALLRLELRRLCDNRPAGLVLALLVAASWFLQSGDGQPIESQSYDCYVVYWRADAWVERLRESARDIPNRKLRIAVVPVHKMTDATGLINYPAGAHSIQLRPLPASKDGRPRWQIWCWYAGANPDAMRPYTKWFWGVTEQHFAGGPAWQVRSSPLQTPMSSPIAGTQLDRLILRSPNIVLRIGVLLLAMFFVACYLPMLGLAQDRSQQTIHSVALTSAGWLGIAVSRWLFHFVGAMLVAVVILAVADAERLIGLRIWIAVAATCAAYLGLGFTIGSLCRNAATAGAAIVAYGLSMAGLLYGAHYFGAPWAAYVVMERNAFVANLGDTNSLPALCGLALVWTLIGIVSFRRTVRFPA